MKAPAFLLYVGDFLSSPDVQMMDTREIGAYCLLLFNAWQGDLHGHLPNNEDKMRRLAKLTPEQWEVSREMILGKFPVADGGLTRYNPRMVAEAEKQENYRLRQAENGKRGGRPKKPDESQINPTLLEENPTLSESKPNDNPNESFSISSSITIKEKLASSAGQDSASLIKSPTASSRPTPRPAKLFRYDNAPAFLITEFFTFLLAQGYGHVDRAMYLQRIQEGARKGVQDTRKLKEEATNDEWKAFILRWLDADKANKRLLLPDEAPRFGAYPGPNPALQVTTTSTSYSREAIAARNVTKY